MGETNLLDNTSRNILIDEAFNSFLTKIYLDNIQLLKSLFIDDKQIKSILDNFDFPNGYEYPSAYCEAINQCIKLFKSKKFSYLFYNAALYKDFEPLYAALDTFFKCDFSFYIFSSALDNEDYTKIEQLFSMADWHLLEEQFRRSF